MDSLRIHELIFLEFDLSDNFAALVRFNEIKKYGEDRVKITIPKKIRNELDLNLLLRALKGYRMFK